MEKIKVLVVDDSALVRSLLAGIVNAQPDMSCIGAASDPLVAREMIRNLNPDVLTLDVEMPRMDGIDFLEKLMRLRPMPVVMVSTLTERGAEVTMRALELGAIDFVAKPKIGVSRGLSEAAAEIVDKIRIASRARVFRRAGAPAVASTAAVRAAPVAMPAGGSGQPASRAPSVFRAAPAPAPALASRSPLAGVRTGTEKLIAIGASTGGTEAIRAILITLPHDFPAVVITQHMPPGFTRSFAERLNSQCRIEVMEARHQERLLPGHAYIAPGGMHLRLERSGANYIAVLDETEPVNRHRPSVEVLFNSVAQCVGPNAIGVMLTGMGRDGADGMRRMRDAGSYNIAQDEATCVVYGMPREAVLAGAIHESLPIQSIGAHLMERIQAMPGVSHRI
ncbi:MAG TPA: chemotaxis response regulator protein-glutamate methylesterase [Burkholderiaceae bacterium]|nr:chemotaxis response regulator protein-glutamate methylesterase [Burkholderiaceae bacterium]